MSCCCGVGTGTADCCCEQSAETYSVEFSGITDYAGTGSAEVGCTLLNRRYCLCYASCGLYAGGGDANPSSEPATYDYMKLVLEFDCNAVPNGTGSGTGTSPESGVVRLTVYGANSDPGWVGSTFYGDPLAIYLLDRDTWKCAGLESTLHLSWSSSYCLGWPSTVLCYPNQDTFACLCHCSQGVIDIGETLAYELTIDRIYGGVGSGGDCDNECSCESTFARICMSPIPSLGTCYWGGSWTPPASTLREYSLLRKIYGESGAITGLPSNCAPMWDSRVEMYYDFETESIVVNVGPSEETEANGEINYSISVSSFDPLGNNVLTLRDSTYTKCTVPSTINVNFWSRNGCGSYFPCDICGGASYPGGWAFTIAGVSGTTVDHRTGAAASASSTCTGVPCEAFNGDYCLAFVEPPIQYQQGCYWEARRSYYLGASVPDQYEYQAVSGGPCYEVSGATLLQYKAEVEARMSIEAGIVTVQIALFWSQTSNTFGGTTTEANNRKACQRVLMYQIATEDFNCNGSNTLTLLCNKKHISTFPDAFTTTADDGDPPCDCTGIPTSITISPSTSCGETPPSSCDCLPKASYSPRALITGFDDAGCDQCACMGQLDLCFTAHGDADACIWRANVTHPSVSPADCYTNATYAEMTIGVAPYENDLVITLYNSVDVAVARFQQDISGGMDCDVADFELLNTYSSDNCDWSAATITLDMHGAACPTCYPCAASDWISPPQAFYVVLEYAGVTYAFCMSRDYGCTAEPFTSADIGTGYIYPVLEFGSVPSEYARILVYFSSISGTGSGSVLIGVYNYLSALNLYDCAAGPNTFNLATGNAGQCGYDIDETGYTEYLSSTAQTYTDDCPECGGTPMPPVIDVSITSPTGGATCDCTVPLSTTAVYNRTTGKWEGQFFCDGEGVYVDFQLYQSGTTCSSLRMDLQWNSLCDSDVSAKLPDAGCVCGTSVTFRTQTAGPRLHLTFSW